MRPVIGLLAGVLAGLVVTMGIDALAHALYPPPPGLDLKDTEGLALLVKQTPKAIAVLVAWGLGVFVGASVAFRLAQGAEWPGWAVGFTLLAGAGWTLLRIPHPLWLSVMAILLMPLAAYAASRLFVTRA